MVLKLKEKRQISEAEKKIVLDQHGRRCFVDGAPIPDEETLEFHHIKPFSGNGASVVDNIAPVCKDHHKRIGTMSLQEYRDKLELEDFFKDGKPKYLDDLIRYKRGKCGEKLKYEIIDDLIRLYFIDKNQEFPLYTCPITKWNYFYAALPVEYLENDKELQPRAIRGSNLWSLYRHFQINTQLAPSICRTDDNQNVLLFDGQHKAAA